MPLSPGNRSYLTLMTLICLVLFLHLVYAQRAFVLNLQKGNQSMVSGFHDLQRRVDLWSEWVPPEIVPESWVWADELTDESGATALIVGFESRIVVVRDAGVRTW